MVVLGQHLGLHDIYLHTKDPCGICLGRVIESHLALTRDLASMGHMGHPPSLIAVLLASGCGLRPLSKLASTFTFSLGGLHGRLRPWGLEVLVRSMSDPCSFHLSTSEGPA